MARDPILDTTEVKKLARTLAAAPLIVNALAAGVINKGALNIKNDAANRVAGLSHAPAYPRSIRYQPHRSAASFEAEIGPDTTRPQWALGDILEFGTPRTAPHPHLMPALQAELPTVERYLLALAMKSVD